MYEDKVPHHIYTSKQRFKNFKNSMKDFNRFMTNKTKHDKNISVDISNNVPLAHKC